MKEASESRYYRTGRPSGCLVSNAEQQSNSKWEWTLAAGSTQTKVRFACLSTQVFIRLRCEALTKRDRSRSHDITVGPPHRPKMKLRSGESVLSTLPFIPVGWASRPRVAFLEFPQSSNDRTTDTRLFQWPALPLLGNVLQQGCCNDCSARLGRVQCPRPSEWGRILPCNAGR